MNLPTTTTTVRYPLAETTAILERDTKLIRERLVAHDLAGALRACALAQRDLAWLADAILDGARIQRRRT